MKRLPPYTKTVAGAVVLVAAALALKFRLISYTDAGSAAMTGLALMGVGVRSAVAQVPQAVADHAEQEAAALDAEWSALKGGQ
jgi:hypothetical protein